MSIPRNRIKRALIVVILMVLAGGAAFGRTSGSNSTAVELNVAGLTIVGNRWLDTLLMGRFGLGVYSKGLGFELGVIGAPWYEMEGALIDGALVINPLFDKPLSPVIRLGAMTSTGGGFLPFVGGGIRIRLAGQFGLRAEYQQFLPFGLGAVGGGAYFRF
jgi:hypothetical protein